MSEFEMGSWEDPIWNRLLNVGMSRLHTRYADTARTLDDSMSGTAEEAVRDFVFLEMRETFMNYDSVQRVLDEGSQDDFDNYAFWYMDKQLPKALRLAFGFSERKARDNQKKNVGAPECGTVFLATKQKGHTKKIPNLKTEACAVALTPVRVYRGEVIHTGDWHRSGQTTEWYPEFDIINVDPYPVRVEISQGRRYDTAVDSVSLPVRAGDNSSDSLVDDEVVADFYPEFSTESYGGGLENLPDPLALTPEDQVIEKDLQDRAAQAIRQLSYDEADRWGQGFFSGQSVRDSAKHTKPTVSYRTVARRREAGLEYIKNIPPLEGLE